MPAESRWVPLSRRGQADAEALHEGVPPWLRQSLWDWVYGLITGTTELGQRFPDKPLLQRLERRLKTQFQWGQGVSGAVKNLAGKASIDEEFLLDLVDALLVDINPDFEGAAAGEYLESVLVEGGSVWGVAVRDGRLGLERRVDETVTAAAREVIGASGAAGEHLTRAWTEAYGRSPDPSAAYSEAVKAVEAAAKPTLTPKDDKATLGKMVPALRDGEGKWDVVLAARPEFNKVEAVRLMADLLWQGQTDRHGRPDPRPVTQEQAEAAVHLAVLLVHWFSSGVVRRVE